MVSQCVGGSGRLTSFDSFLSCTEVGFELGPRLGGREGLVPSSDVIGENCRTRDDN